MWTLIWFSNKENNKYSLLAAERMNLLDYRFQKSCVFLLLQWTRNLTPSFKKNKQTKKSATCRTPGTCGLNPMVEAIRAEPHGDGVSVLVVARPFRSLRA